MSRPLPPHTDRAHAAITTELVRLSLPHHPSMDRPALEAPPIELRPSRRYRPGGVIRR